MLNKIHKHRYIYILLILISCLFLTSCKVEKYSDVPQVEYKNILSCDGNKDNKYYVIIYSTTCNYCENLEAFVVDYYNKTKNKSDLPYIYVLCVDKIENKEIKAKSDDEYNIFMLTKDYQKIKVSAEPALIEVTNNSLTKVVSSKTTRYPYTEIKNLLNNTLGE
ncbi:MAG: hypothetical protein SOY80_06060 [Bacilli bacterium]|nr:hypothetical protein [Bacilli bacterium]